MKPTLSPQASQIAAWSLGVIVCLLGLLAWGHDHSWKFLPFNAYSLFPLLGILAFSLMWTHYVIGTLREMTGVAQATLASYFRITGYVVLGLICLHPGLLIYQRLYDGYGLPPHSYETYVRPGLGWVTLLGTLSLLIFLAFELHRVFGKRSWWHYVVDASDLAMLLVFYHALRLGDELQQSWFHFVWWFYGLTLIAVLARKYIIRFQAAKKVAAK
jgi:hypothetical protein